MTIAAPMAARPASAADRNGIQVIARAAAILRAIEGEPAGLTLGELAARLGLARSTVQRIVAALSDEGLLASAGLRAGVTLGPALTRLAAATVIDAERLARPILQDLSARTGETVDLSILQGGSAVFVDQVMGSSRLVAVSAVGEAFPLHCTANGKALLSRQPADRRERLLAGTMPRFTPNTIVSRALLEAELAEVEATGLSWDVEEHAEGICAVGAAFTDAVGRDLALSIPVPAARFGTSRDALGKAILAAVAEIVRMIPGASSTPTGQRKPG